MSAPKLYIKHRCPHCEGAMDYLDQRQIAYDKIDVRADAGKMKELQEISGQTKTPTMVWSGSVLANFGVDELKPFLEERQSESGRGL